VAGSSRHTHDLTPPARAGSDRQSGVELQVTGLDREAWWAVASLDKGKVRAVQLERGTVWTPRGSVSPFFGFTWNG
jgi:hypothetical protein